MNVFLTGGTGFIGSYVALELVKHGHHVTILARNRNKVPELTKISALEIVPGDITDRKLLEQLVAGKDACILVALNYTKKTGWEVLLDDTLPTVFLSDAAAQAKVKHFIYTSSTAANDSLYMGARDEAEKDLKQCHRRHEAASGHVLWRHEGRQRKFCHRAISCFADAGQHHPPGLRVWKSRGPGRQHSGRHAFSRHREKRRAEPAHFRHQT